MGKRSSADQRACGLRVPTRGEVAWPPPQTWVIIQINERYSRWCQTLGILEVFWPADSSGIATGCQEEGTIVAC